MGLGLSTMNCIIRNSPRQYVIEWGCMKSNHPAQSLYNKIKTPQCMKVKVIIIIV